MSETKSPSTASSIQICSNIFWDIVLGQTMDIVKMTLRNDAGVGYCKMRVCKEGHFKMFLIARKASGFLNAKTCFVHGCNRLRIMLPDDANIVGNVHGGTILKMIEEAGGIISTRHCNSQPGDRCVAALARVERTDFLHAMFIGEVAHVSAEITYTSKHSVEVQVSVVAENILTGAKKVTNKATLWYVPFSLKNIDKIIEVPAIEYSSPEQEEGGRKRYEAQKLERLETKERNGEVVMTVLSPEAYTVEFSQSSLIHLVGPSDCTLHSYVHGGVTMKLMDEVAGIVAARHCKTNVVTASVDAINFHRKIKIGCVLSVSGRMTFTSNKSMEIEVIVDADPLVEADKGKYRAVTAFFTYISLDKESKPLPVPPLKIENEEEQKRFEEGKARYLQNKAKRLAEKERQQ